MLEVGHNLPIVAVAAHREGGDETGGDAIAAVGANANAMPICVRSGGNERL